LAERHPATTGEASVSIQPEQPTAKGPAEWSTGDVYIDGIVRGDEPSRVRVSAVRFTPSARTARHSHAVGQTLYVTEGRGLHQLRGGGIETAGPRWLSSPSAAAGRLRQSCVRAWVV
jgi:quercetin dioxygenase-like cupin family protein